VARPGPTSLIDRVDDANRPIGRVRRADAFRVRANFRTVHVLVLNNDGDLLLQQLAPTRERNPCKWGSSVAGYMHAGETYRHAAQRRLAEELGLHTPLSEVGVTPMNDEGVTKFVGVYTTVSDKPQVAEPEHIEAIQFRPLSEIEQGISNQPDSYTETLRHVLDYWISEGQPGLPSPVS
jgi:isopentenyl-diphosphate delta-isomerase